MASTASLSLRSRLRSGVRKSTLASCWVMVLPPSTMRPRRKFWYTARAIPMGSTPKCEEKRASSVAITACLSAAGIWARGTKIRRSTWSSVICSSFSSYTLEPTLGSKLSSWVTEGSERGRMVSTQKAATPAASTPTLRMTTSGTTIHRNQRRRRFGDGEACFPRGSRAIDCYYTRVNPTVSIDTQLARIRRGTAQIEVEAELRAKIARSLRDHSPLKVKLGLDPTAPDLHLGHTVVLQKLRDFQELGHQIIIIIGDFTGMIGDPTGRSETRKPLTWEEIRANAETYKAQLGRVIDMGRTEVRFNSEWLGRLTFEQVIRETSHLTVARMLERQDFAARYASGRAISLHEFLYPLAQGYDSVALGADVELGGTDQTFNLLVGRDLQRALGQAPQVALTVPILEGLDGVQKMSKSLGNYVGIDEKPEDVYGKLMSLSDGLMWRYYELLTRVSTAETASLKAGHPMEAKKKLAHTITAMYHGEANARAGEAHFARVVQGKQAPDVVEEQPIPTPKGGVTLVKALVQSGLVASSSEARRLILQGAVELNGTQMTEPMQLLHASPEPQLLRVGKRRYKSLILQAPTV